MPHDVADKVRALNLDGISIVQEDSGVRDYRGGRLAVNVIGFVGIDENGLDGAEYEYDSLLKGTPGRISLEADEFGRPIPFGQTTTLERASRQVDRADDRLRTFNSSSSARCALR